MTVRAPRRRTPVFILPVGLLARILIGVTAAVLVIVVVASGAVARVAGGAVVADRPAVTAQQAVAERDLARGYELATDQVRKARALKLAIPAQQADAIANKAFADLFTLRHSALVSLAQLTGAPLEAADSHAKRTEQAMDAARGQPSSANEAVLLAPRLYAIVSRFNDLATRISDQATTDLTQSPTPAPTVRPTPTPTPTPSR